MCVSTVTVEHITSATSGNTPFLIGIKNRVADGPIRTCAGCRCIRSVRHHSPISIAHAGEPKASGHVLPLHRDVQPIVLIERQIYGVRSPQNHVEQAVND
jgi:hypothetical protein